MNQNPGTRWAGKCPVCQQVVVISIGSGIGPDQAVARMVRHQYQGRECNGTGQRPLDIRAVFRDVTRQVGDVVGTS